MRVRLGAAGLAVTAIVATAAMGTVAIAQDGGGGRSPEELVDRLVAVERDAPSLPPAAILVDDETTWGELTGDFRAAELDLSLKLDQLTQLFTDADDGNGPVPEAVSTVARGYLQLHQAYSDLANYDEAGLGQPTGTTDADDVATGSDELRGLAQTGLDLLLDARARMVDGYLILRDAAEADATEKSLFDAAYRDTERFLREDAALLHEMLSFPTLSVVVVRDRFGTTAPGSQAKARSMTITCIDRGLYPFTAENPAGALEQLAADDLTGDTLDCPELPNDNVVVPNRG